MTIKHKLVDYDNLPRRTFGSFPKEIFTPEGRKAFDKCKAFLKRSPTYRGASKTGLYFKWNLLKDEDQNRYYVLGDMLMEMGFDVSVELTDNKERIESWKKKSIESGFYDENSEFDRKEIESQIHYYATIKFKG